MADPKTIPFDPNRRPTTTTPTTTPNPWETITDEDIDAAIRRAGRGGGQSNPGPTKDGMFPP